jgi:zinc protease
MHKIIQFASLSIILCLVCAFHFVPKLPKQSFSFTLSNGMNVVGIPNHKIAAVTHMLWYKVGAADELPGKSGFAHLFEHLMFKKTAMLKSGEFSRLISYYGGNDNAFTGQNFTAYFQTISREHLPLVMLMEAERMRNLMLDDETVNNERNIVLEERSMRVDNDPGSLLMEKMNQALFQTHPYGTPVIGWRKEIEKLYLADSAEFYKTYYNPNNATIVVSGDIVEEDLRALTEKYYGNLKAGLNTASKRAHITIMPPAVKEHKITHVDERVKTPEWIKILQAPSANTGAKQHAIPLVVLANVLGGGETGRLYQSLVVEQKLAASAGAYYDDVALGPTTFSLYATPNKGVSFEQVSKAVDSEVQKILTNGITKDELLHTQRSLNAEYIYSRDGVRSMAFIYGHVLAANLSTDYIEQWSDHLNHVSLTDVHKAAQHVLPSSNYVIGTLEPKK